MSVNKYKPHLFVIPEDDANRQIADGFVLHPRVVARQMQVVEPAGGWPEVLNTFKHEYVPLLKKYEHTHVVMIVDFDENVDGRRSQVKAGLADVPEQLRTRFFVIGSHGTPESLRQTLGKGFENIGRALADDCDGNRTDTWGHEMLRHNEQDRLRLLETVKSFLLHS